MQALITILCVAALAVVVVQDFRERMISWYLIPLLFLLFSWNALLNAPFKEVAFGFGVNLAFTAFQLLAITIYFSIKNKKPVNIINTWLGIGDVLLLATLCVAFSPVNYFVFYMGSLLLTIAGFAVYRLFKGTSATIPLAGAMALVMIVCLCYQAFLMPFVFHNDAIALNLLKLD